MPDFESLPGCFPNRPWRDMRFEDELALPLGVWRVAANGRFYPLAITDVSSSGVVTGFFNGEAIDDGRWDNSTTPGKLSFVRVVATAPPHPLRQQFRGYLMSFDPRDYYRRLAGVFGKEDTAGYVEQAGWYATLPRYGE